MNKKWTYKELEAFGRTKLSGSFYMREFLHSEIAQLHGLLNAPDDAELALTAGTQLCERVLEPIAERWGKIHIRSGYRSSEVNRLGNEKKLNCAGNDKNVAAHIWDQRDSSGLCGATACVVIPAYSDYFDCTGDWASLAWWLHQNIPDYYEMCFFKEMCAFNIRWYEGADNRQSIKSYCINPDTADKTALLSKGVVSSFYRDMPDEQRSAKAEKVLVARPYPEEFKIEAVKQVTNCSYKINEVAEKLLEDSTWVR